MRIQHARVSLGLHELAPGPRPALLLLHALYGSSADWDALPDWPGRIYALDFCGHGDSEWLAAGGYTPELLAADADCALAHIGGATIGGAGLGAYVALLLAGARRDLVPAALLLPGNGLAGAGAVPDFDAPRTAFYGWDSAEPGGRAYDPAATVLEEDIRPVDYVEPFARAARKLLLVEDARELPPWWLSVRASPNAEVLRTGLALTFTRLAERVCENRDQIWNGRGKQNKLD